MFEIQPPIIFILIGLLMTFFPDQFGLVFCRLGKMIWKFGTLGLTDMRWFYPEDKAPATFRRMGPFFILIGIIFAGIVLLSFSGPNPFALSREIEIYLHEKYGPSEYSNINFQTSTEPENIINYRYNGNTGQL